jgi:hypothetical protein
MNVCTEFMTHPLYIILSSSLNNFSGYYKAIDFNNWVNNFLQGWPLGQDGKLLLLM